MAYIPAICTNPACNCIFASGIDLLGKGVATFNNCTAGPCPQCGGIGKIPDGEYQFLRDGIFASLFNIPDITQLSRIKQILETAKNDAKFQEKLAAAAPELKSQSAVLDWAKENQVILDLIIKFITVLIVVLTYLKSNPAPLNITQQTIINQSFYHFYNPDAPIPDVLDLIDNTTSRKR